MSRNFSNALIAALLLPMMLTGCAVGAGIKPKSVALPPAPSCMAPVAVPQIITGMDARLALARNRVALMDANGRLACSHDWYNEIRQNYAKQ